MMHTLKVDNMNLNETKLLQMAMKISKLLDNMAASWMNDSELSQYKFKMDLMLHEIQNRLDDNFEISESTIVQKAELKKSIAMKAYLVAAGLYSYAEETNDHRIKQIADFSENKIYKINDAQFVPTILPLVTESMALLENNEHNGTANFLEQGISRSLLSEIHYLLKQYVPLVNKANQVKVIDEIEKKDLSEIISDLHKLIEYKMDLRLKVYKNTQPLLYKSYSNTRNFNELASKN